MLRTDICASDASRTLPNKAFQRKRRAIKKKWLIFALWVIRLLCIGKIYKHASCLLVDRATYPWIWDRNNTPSGHVEGMKIGWEEKIKNKLGGRQMSHRQKAGAVHEWGMTYRLKNIFLGQEGTGTVPTGEDMCCVSSISSGMVETEKQWCIRNRTVKWFTWTPLLSCVSVNWLLPPRQWIIDRALVRPHRTCTLNIKILYAIFGHVSHFFRCSF